jgi:hypothetical protein
MASTYTTNLGIEKIATGEQSGTWGATTNTNLDLIDQAVNGVVQITVAATGSTGSPNALTITNGSASDGRNKFIDFYSPTDLGGTVYYQLDPNDAEKIAFVRNSLGGGQTLVLFQGTYNASNDVEVPNGVDMLVKFDGTGASATVTNVFEKLQVNALSVNDGNITNVGDIALDSISADGTDINVSVSDNSATALTVKEGSNTYLTIDTTNSAEKVLVSKTLDIGDNNITNVGNIALDSISADGTQIDIDITDNTASAFTISEGANNYIAITTTDGSELITVSKNSTFAGTTIADLGVVTTVDINGGTIDGVTIGGASAGAITGTTITGTSFVSSGNMTFGDDDKAIFGAGSDLQIYHSGTSSRIQDLGTGNLIIDTDGTEIQLTSGNISQYMLRAVKDGAVTLYHNGTANPRIATTATGVNVTGTVTADGLTVDGTTLFLDGTFTTGSTPTITLGDSSTYFKVLYGSNAAIGGYTGVDIFGTASGNKIATFANGGDISFYEDTGVTPKMVWKAADERLGIGTDSPAYKLDVASAVIQFGDSTDAFAQYKSSAGNWHVGANSSNAFSFYSGTYGSGTQRMTLDSSGNLGLGVTPSAWRSSTPAFQIGGSGVSLFSDSGIAAGLGNNMFLNASSQYIYQRTDLASRYQQYQGIHSWHTAPSGTAGDAITFTQAMTLDASGNLGIGPTLPGFKLDISGGGTTAKINTLDTNDGGASLSTWMKVGRRAGTGTNVYINTLHDGSDAVSALTWAFGTSGTGSEVMRLDSSGNLLMGNGVTAGTSSAGNLVLTNGTVPTGNVTNGITLYAEDVSASSELKVRDEAGNVTTLSPHNFDLIPEGPSEDMAWSYYSERDGKRINVDMLKAIRLLEQLTGEKLVHTS